MTATWMLYALLVGALVAVAALGAEGVCRLAGRPARWVWAGAMLLTLALVASAPARIAPPPPELPTDLTREVELPEATALPAASDGRSPGELLAAAPRWLREVLASAAARAPRALELYLGAVWALSAAALLAAIGFTHYRFVRRLRRWPTSELHGTRVRVTPDLGPAVVGVRRAEIVVPRWFLALPAADTRLVLEHEREHLRARDPLLLTLAWSVAALLAWNPALWWMLSRLRLAMELDCDARVLGRGADRHSYGSVLIDLAGRSARLRPGMIALADPPSALERRLLAMTSRRARFAAARAALLGTLAGTALLAACRAELPTAAQIQALDVAQAEKAADALALITEAGTTYTLDGVVVTPEVARAVAPDNIASITINRMGPPSEPARVAIVTRVAEADAGFRYERAVPPGAQAGGQAESVVYVRGVSELGPTPVLLVDGVRRPYDARTSPFGDMPPNEIESVSVIKDSARGVELVGPDGVNGVIVVRTKNGPDDGLVLPEARALVAAAAVSVAQSNAGMTRAQFDAGLATAHPATAVWIIDGIRVQKADVLALDPAEVLRVIVADTPTPEMRAELGADAEHGMVQIATTRGRTRQPER